MEIGTGVQVLSSIALRSVRIFRVLKLVCLVPSSKRCLNNLTPFRHVSLIKIYLVKIFEIAV